MNNPDRNNSNQNNSNRNNPDQAIDRLLAGLRDAEPPAGMESRILHALETRAAAPPSRLSSRPTTRWAVASACALAAVSALAFYLAHRPAAPTALVATYPPAARPGSIPPQSVSSQIRPRPQQPESDHPRASIPAQPPTTAPPPAESLDATHAPSLLAPPMPLTEQERLLLRIVHRGDVIEVAMLTTPESAAQKRQNDIDYDRFFAPPAPPPPVPDLIPEAPGLPQAPEKPNEKVEGDTQ